MKSLPFYAILFAHMGQNYGYETLMTELPTYMKQVLRFSIKEVSPLKFNSEKEFIQFRVNAYSYYSQNGTLSALPYLAMWLFSMFISVIADWMIYSDRFTHTSVRKIINSLGMFSDAGDKRGMSTNFMKYLLLDFLKEH